MKKSQKGEGKLIPPIPFSLNNKHPGPEAGRLQVLILLGTFPMQGPLVVLRPAGRKSEPEHSKKMTRYQAHDADG